MKQYNFDPLNDGKSKLELVAATTLWDNQKYTIDQMPLLAARISTLREGKTGLNIENDRHLMADTLAANKHATPFEHVAFTFRVEAPIFVFREWHRHRTQSYNEASMRYTSDLVGKTYLPKEWRLQSKTNKQGSQNILTKDDLLPNPESSDLTEIESSSKISQQELGYLVWEYSSIIGSMRKIDIANYATERAYSEIFKSYKVLQALGIAKEQCRLPVAVGNYSQMYATALVRPWKMFWDLRADMDAQWEIRQFAYCIGDTISEIIPETWAALTKYKDVSLTNEEIEMFLDFLSRNNDEAYNNMRRRLEKAKLRGVRV